MAQCGANALTDVSISFSGTVELADHGDVEPALELLPNIWSQSITKHNSNL